MTTLSETAEQIRAAAQRAGPAVVGLGRGWGVGSGVLIGPGQVLTAAHNLRHDEVSVTFGDGRREPGQVRGSDPDLDVAVIDVDAAAIEPIPWSADGEEPELGQPVLALANPGGRGLRVTPGFVSSSQRSFRGPRGRRITGAIEHTAPLPRGSSGGPLLDAEGALIGINAVRVDGGLILAIPADRHLHERVDALARGESPGRVRLGIAVAPPRVARRLRAAVGLPERDGVLVRGVQEGSAAERAGLVRGDLIVAADGVQLDGIDPLYAAIDRARSSGSLALQIVRGTDEQSITVSFERP